MQIEKVEGLYNNGLYKLEGVNDIYYAFDDGGIDYYEIEELKEAGYKICGNELSFYFYPEHKIYTPFQKEYGVYYDSCGVLYYENYIYFMRADFNSNRLSVYCYNIDKDELQEYLTLDLNELDTYNLRIAFEPLTVYSSHDELKIYYPENITITEAGNEDFVFRKGNRFYFSAWFEENIGDVENYKYYEMYIVKDEYGNLIEKGFGVIEHMADGEYIIV